MKIYNADFFGRHLLSGSISELGNDTSYSGSFKGNLNGTASYAVTASYLLGLIASASFATNALTASYFDGFIESASYSTYAVSSSYALSSSYFSGTVNSASHSNNANTASYYGGNVISSSYSLSSSYTNKSSLSDSSTTSSHSNQSTSASYYGGSVASSSYALSASWSPGSNSVSSSYSISSSFSNKTSLADSSISSSHSTQASSASYYGGSVISSSYSLSSSYAPPFPTSSYSLQALSASYAPGSPSVSSSYSVSSSFANKSSLADSSTSSSYSTLAMGSIFSKSLFADIKNVSGGTITKGMVISVSSTDVDAGYASVTLGEQSISDNSNKVIGVVYSNSIADTAYGYAIIRGLLTGIDTSANMVGDVLYLRNAGLFESGEPAWPNHSVRIGICLVSDPANGIILVHPDNGYQFNELHDVSINSPQYGDLISISNSGTYINSKFLTGSYTISGSLTVPQLIGTSSYALMAATASYLLGSIASASHSEYAETASLVISSSYAVTASYALNGGSSAGTTIIDSLMLDMSQHNWNPTGIDTANIIRMCGNAQMSDLTGMISQSSSPIKTLFNTGSIPIIITGNHPSSSDGNRFELGQDLYLAPNRSVQVLYDNSKWQIISPPMPPLKGFIEYLSIPGSVTAGDYSEMAMTAFNSGVVANFVGTSTTPAGWGLSTSTTTNGGYVVRLLKGGAIIETGAAHISMRFKVSLETLSDVTNEYKLWLDHSTTATGELLANSFGVRYSYNSSSGNFEGYSIDGSSRVSSVDLGVAAAALTPYVIEIELNKRRSEVRFYINDAFCGSLNANLPAAASPIAPRVFIRKAVGATARRVIVHELYTRILM